MAGPETNGTARVCPKCGSTNTHLVQRGFAGAADSPNQFYVCQDCGHQTYEIISRTRRELRIDRIEPGRRFKFEGAEYTISRVLQAGLTESLVYVKPVPFPTAKQ